VRRLFVFTAAALLALIGLSGALHAADKGDDDTPAAKKTRELLAQKVTCDYKDTPLREVVDDLKDQIKGLHVQIDSKGGVSANTTITYTGKDVPLTDALDAMFKKNGLGFLVISKKGNAYDGILQIKQGKERGRPLDEK
jgi:type II secretory pathway component GspD/PulD (secretin)